MMKSLRNAGSLQAARARPEMLGRPLEELAIGEDRHAHRAGFLVALGDRRGIEILAQHALRRTRALDFRDHRGSPLSARR